MVASLNMTVRQISLRRSWFRQSQNNFVRIMEHLRGRVGLRCAVLRLFFFGGGGSFLFCKVIADLGTLLTSFPPVVQI